MNTKYKQEAISFFKAFLAENNLEPPKTAKEYDVLATKAHKYHRSQLCSHGVKATVDIIPALCEGIPPEPTSFYTRVQNYCSIFDMTFISEHTPENTLQKSKITLTCKTCGYKDTVSATSVARRSEGCRYCTGKLRLGEYQNKLNDILSELGFSIAKAYNIYSAKGAIDVTCNKCGTKVTRTLAHIVYRKKLHCPSCNPCPIYGQLGTKKTLNGIEFDSTIELEAFRLISAEIADIVLKPTYRQLGVEGSLFEADFLVDSQYVVEVTSFNKHHEKYHHRILEKQYLIESCTKYVFIFCNSLADVKDFLSVYKNL